ncbi:hypothetical protein Baya_0422 [Bagarius yarrelli]|uniref:ZAD domain-containing protein n=1 Tax=Bagarius yarrelli TaxID=175774 RepID=A0A556TI74_BAGYA|nr:hypothetical protein Baya_0422 [Bagarius yarrelli]
MADECLESLFVPRKPTENMCRLCSENFKPSKTNKHRLFRGIDSIAKAEFTVVLERFVGKLQERSSAICTSCRRVLTRYDSVSKEVTRLKSQIDDLCRKTREIRGEPSSPTRDLPPDDANLTSSPVLMKVYNREAAVLNLTRRARKPFRTLMNNIYRRRHRVLAKNMMKIPGQSQLIIDEVLKNVEKECRFLISKKFQSASQASVQPHLAPEFKCEKVLDEWRTVAPTFLQFLKCVSAATSFIKHRTKGAKVDAGESWSRKKPEVTMAGLILLKARSKLRLSRRYQRIGGAKRRRIERISRVSGSQSATRKKMTEIAETWDDGFLEWRKVCECPCLDDLSWIHEPAYSSCFYSDHTYNCQEGQVETVIVDTSGDEIEEVRMMLLMHHIGHLFTLI